MLQSGSDLDLLFGILALRNGLVDQGALVAAIQAWSRDKSRTLAERLLDRGDLDADDRAAIEALVARHLKRHGGAPEKSLAAISQDPLLRQQLAAVGDAELDATLGHVATKSVRTEGFGDALGTNSYSMGAGTALGARFRVLRPHAKGGIGQVCVALDTELSREVALKEIQPHLADDVSSRGRFLLEAEITGRLEHPGVVPVYGLGVDAQGRPYYAMRFIRGDSLKQAIERMHAGGKEVERGRSAGTLALRGLLSRFVAVCNALAYAHSRGVIHRDVKPANVMLGPYGETLVVDWGLAKVIGRDDPPDEAEATLRPRAGHASGSSETQAGTAIGTPAYMSPEQADGRLDAIGPASDVYSLGATLYCLVTGRPPITDGDVLEVLRKARCGDFPAPRQANPRVPPGLEAIVLKAMNVVPANRYSSARSLASDVEHWLADEPVAAYREPALPRLARWGRRHKTVVAGAGTLLLAAVVALSAGTLLLQNANVRTSRERDAARKNFLVARQAVDECLARVGRSPVLKEQGFHDLRLELLEAALRYYEDFLTQRGSESSLQAETASAYEHVGDIHKELGRFELALAAYSQGLALTPESPSDRALVAARIRMERGRIACLSPLGRFDEGIAAFERAILPFASGQLATNDTRGDLRGPLAKLFNSGAQVYSDSGKTQEGQRASKRALEYSQEYTHDHPADRDALDDLMFAYTYTTRNLIVAGNPDEALEIGVQGIREGEAIVKQYPRDIDLRVDLGDLFMQLATIEHPKGQSKQALSYTRRAVELAESVSHDDPRIFRAIQVLLATLNYQSSILSDLGELAEARRSADHSVKLIETFLEQTPESVGAREMLGSALASLGKVHLLSHDAGRAIATLKRAARVLETSRECVYLYNAACCVSMASSVDDPAEPSAAQGAQRRKRDAEQAIVLLKKAIDHGLADAAMVTTDHDLDPIRTHPQFSQMLSLIQGRAKRNGVPANIR